MNHARRVILSQSRFDPGRGKRHPANPNTGGIEDGVVDGRRSGTRRWFPGAGRRTLDVIDENDLELRNVLPSRDRIAVPIDAGDVSVVERNLFL